MKRRATVFASGLALLALAAAPGALANGRFPRAERVIEADSDPSTLVLAATYGLLVTHDGGADWRHICELGYAFTVDEIDSMVALLPDGALLVEAARSLNRAAEPHCSFEPVLGGESASRSVDFSQDQRDRSRVIALMLGPGENGSVATQVYESLDAGVGFEKLGTPLPAELSFALTLDSAPSDPKRLYVSATGRDVPGVVARSDDAGAHWTTAELPLEPAEWPYLAGIHPTDPDLLYVRTDFWQVDSDGVYSANDGLFFSDDAGRSWREILRAGAKLLGFALSPDGSQVLVAYGDPVEPSRELDRAALGIYRASARDHAFTKIFEGPVSCLGWTTTAVYACTSQLERGFALGLAPDANFELDAPDPFTPLLDLTRVAGPLDCPACSSGSICRATWADNCGTFAGCAPGATSGGTGGTDPAECAAGGMAEVGGSSTGGTGGSGPTLDESSCGCRVAGGRERPGYALGLLLIASLAALRRTRSRRRAFSAKTGFLPLSAGAPLIFASACGGEPAATEPGPLCEGRGEPLSVGMTKSSADASLAAELVGAEPLPPETGDNAWTLRLSSASGEPVREAVVVVHALMIDHDHPAPAQLGVETEPGVYEVTPITLTMPGYWEMTFGVTAAETEQELVFGVCVER